MAGALGHFQPRENHRIEESGAHLAYTAAGTGLQLAVNNDRRFLIPVGCGPGAGGAVVGKITAGLQIGAADFFRRQGNVAAPVGIAAEMGGVFPKDRIDFLSLFI